MVESMVLFHLNLLSNSHRSSEMKITEGFEVWPQRFKAKLGAAPKLKTILHNLHEEKERATPKLKGVDSRGFPKGGSPRSRTINSMLKKRQKVQGGGDQEIPRRCGCCPCFKVVYSK
ncbi:hypothetical protein DSO57_1030345 [Entomophthora muscae]|uniref:Uncharacterized protein n=1 Tax=Entomophthora muscae TaxID=34485 RepID=A0ACC2RS26_9FUNG|nr:hypothetical protein DSO57_1030345 [Entomophthora muscae]